MMEDYRVSNSDVIPKRTLAIFMKQMKNCELVGNGARLWMSGHMQVFTLDRCENISISGFKVNWKKPLVAEAVVESINENVFTVFVDSDKFPHRVKNNTLEFDVGNDEWYPLTRGAIAFEPHSFLTRKGSDDIVIQKIEQISQSRYLFTLRGAENLRVGDYLNIRHNMRIHAGIFAEKSKELCFSDITFYSCGGLGCLAQFCHNVTFKRVNFLPDRLLGRYVSCGRDDGMHLTCNSGKITVTECLFHALMDDPINIHGCCVTSDEVVDKYTLKCRYRHNQACGFHYWAEKGDEIAFIDRRAMNILSTLNAHSYELVDNESFLLRFESEIPSDVVELAEKGELLALDNLSHTAEFECTKNRFGSCRARGILISTPKKVVVSENIFSSSGSAILVAGDSNYWFESGECHDVLISKNIFEDGCLTSDYQFCEGVISICPVVPYPDIDKPYHKNVRIEDNVFDSNGAPILYALSCKGLEFKSNRIFRSQSLEKWHKQNDAIRLVYCTDSSLTDNEWIGDLEFDSYLKEENCKNIKTDIK